MGQFVTNLYPQKVGNTFPFQRISLHITQKESALKHWKSGNSAPSFFTFCHTLMSSPGENFCHWGHQVSPKRKKKEQNNALFGAKFRLLEKKLRRVYEWPRRKRSYLCFLTKIKVLSKTFYKKKLPSKYHFYFKIVGILQLKNSFWNVFIAIQVLLILKMQKLLLEAFLL